MRKVAVIAGVVVMVLAILLMTRFGVREGVKYLMRDEMPAQRAVGETQELDLLKKWCLEDEIFDACQAWHDSRR